MHTPAPPTGSAQGVPHALSSLALSALALGAAVLAPVPAHAELPSIAWDDGNAGYYTEQAPPLARTWTFACDDPSDEWPLELRCMVVDLTEGPLGSGNEVVLVDEVCATAESEPASATYTFDVPEPEEGHRYGYVASCQDAKGNRYRSSRSGYYDPTGPTITLVSAPPPRVSEGEVDFTFTCDDASFGWDFSYLSFVHVAECDFRCALSKADGTSVWRTAACDVPTVADATSPGSQHYGDLPPGAYVFTVFGRDEAGNSGVAVEVPFEVTAPTDIVFDDTADTADTYVPPVDTDQGVGSIDDTDADDEIRGDCSCAAVTPFGGGWPAVGLLGLGVVRRRRRTG
ncbi:MAG: hypothetical protein H6732_14195 [Alphaproteobacteria bacterium]|nr:hypothetical protein [Alphaproteobacteria bacterium]